MEVGECVDGEKPKRGPCVEWPMFHRERQLGEKVLVGGGINPNYDRCL
jgi:hypothetical protein